MKWKSEIIITYIHIWADWKSLDEEHCIFKFINGWFCLSLPNNSDNLLESGWNESKVWYDSNGDWCRGIDKECDWAILTWIRKSKLSDQRTVHVLELKFVTRIDVNKVGANINGWDEGELLVVVLFTTWIFRVLTVVIFVIWIDKTLLLVNHSLHFCFKSIDGVPILKGFLLLNISHS